MEKLPGGCVTTGAVAKVDESSVTATCRTARLEINELALTRKNLYEKIRVLRETLKKTEDDYWSQYHLRLNETNTDTATKLWVASFATKEGVVAEQTKLKLDELRGQIRVLEPQLQKADDEFWGKWQDVITKLATITKSGGTAPEVSEPSAAARAPRSKPKEHVAVAVAVGPLPQPRLTTMLPAYAPQSSASPLAPPAFFPNGPPIARMTTVYMPVVRNPDPPVAVPELPRAVQEPPQIVPELPQQVSETTPELTTPSSSQTDDSIASTSAYLYTTQQFTASLEVPSYNSPQNDDNTASTNAYHDTTKETTPSLEVPSPGSPQTDDKSTSVETQNTTDAQESPPFPGVTQPLAGRLYKAYYKHGDQEGWWVCKLLPTLPAHETAAWQEQVGISFTSPNLDLWHDAPACYTTTVQAKRKSGRSITRHHVVTGWAPGYEDGGPLVHQRAFPVLFFEDRKGEAGYFSVPMPPRKFNFKLQSWDWVEAKDLRPVETLVSPVYGEKSAANYVKRMEALRSSQPFGPSPEESPRLVLADGDPDQTECRPAKRLRIKIIRRDRPSAQDQTQSSLTQVQHETEMTDVGSLSGDTIAASSNSSSATQSDDEISKPC